MPCAVGEVGCFDWRCSCQPYRDFLCRHI